MWSMESCRYRGNPGAEFQGKVDGSYHVTDVARLQPTATRSESSCVRLDSSSSPSSFSSFSSPASSSSSNCTSSRSSCPYFRDYRGDGYNVGCCAAGPVSCTVSGPSTGPVSGTGFCCIFNSSSGLVPGSENINRTAVDCPDPQTSVSPSLSCRHNGFVEMRKEKSRDAARSRRGKENYEFYELAKLLPLPAAIASQLDKASIVRLAVSYLKLRQYSRAGEPAWAADLTPSSRDDPSTNGRNELALENGMQSSFRRRAMTAFYTCDDDPFESYQGIHLLQSMDGFVFVLGNDGRFLYVSETVSIYLGLSQVEMTGCSIFDYVHVNDYEELASELGLRLRSSLSSPSSSSSSGTSSCSSLSFEKKTECMENKKLCDADDEEKINYSAVDAGEEGFVMSPSNNGNSRNCFCIRMKSTLIKRGVHVKSSGYQVVQITTRMRRPFILPPSSSPDDAAESECCVLGLSAMVVALPSPAAPEQLIDGYTFVLKLNRQFRITYCEPRLSQVIDLVADQLMHTSLYDLVHASDLKKLRRGHIDVMEKGQSLTEYYRLLTTHGGYVWVQTCFTLIFNSKNADEQSIVTVNYILSDSEYQEVNHSSRIAGSDTYSARHHLNGTRLSSRPSRVVNNNNNFLFDVCDVQYQSQVDSNLFNFQLQGIADSSESVNNFRIEAHANSSEVPFKNAVLCRSANSECKQQVELSKRKCPIEFENESYQKGRDSWSVQPLLYPACSKSLKAELENLEPAENAGKQTEFQYFRAGRPRLLISKDDLAANEVIGALTEYVPTPAKTTSSAILQTGHIRTDCMHRLLGGDIVLSPWPSGHCSPSQCLPNRTFNNSNTSRNIDSNVVPKLNSVKQLEELIRQLPENQEECRQRLSSVQSLRNYACQPSGFKSQDAVAIASGGSPTGQLRATSLLKSLTGCESLSQTTDRSSNQPSDSHLSTCSQETVLATNNSKTSPINKDFTADVRGAGDVTDNLYRSTFKTTKSTEAYYSAITPPSSSVSPASSCAYDSPQQITVSGLSDITESELVPYLIDDCKMFRNAGIAQCYHSMHIPNDNSAAKQNQTPSYYYVDDNVHTTENVYYNPDDFINKESIISFSDIRKQYLELW